MQLIKYTILSLLFLAVYLPSGAQQENLQIIESLKIANTNEELLTAYEKIRVELEISNPDTLIVLLKEGIVHFQQNNFSKGEAKLKGMLSAVYSTIGMLPLAKSNMQDGLSIFKKINDTAGIAGSHITLGIIEGQSANYESALQHFYTALSLYKKQDNNLGILKAYVKLGVGHEYSGNLDQGLSYYYAALALLKNKPVSRDLITLYNNIGSLYCRKGEFKKAIPYFEKALALASNSELKHMRGYPLLNLGKVFLELGEKEKGMAYLQQALEHVQKQDLPDQEARILLNIAEVTTDQELATNYFTKALDISTKIGDKRTQSEVLESMTDFYKNNKNYEKALEVYSKSQVLKDSMFSVEKAKEIANLESVYELEVSNAKIDELKTLNKKNTFFRNIIIGIASLLAVLLIFSFLFLLHIRKLNTKLVESKQALKKANEDKDRLFSVIGHDLRNHVSNVPIALEMYEDESMSEEERKFLFESLKENSIATRETLDKLLNWGKSQIKGITSTPTNFYAKEKITNKLKLLKSACDQKHITINNHIKDDIKVYADEEHFKFVMRNLLSNAVKYTHHNGTIEIDAQRDTGEIIFSVKDNGIGMTDEEKAQVFQPFIMSHEGTANEKGNGLGLMLCKEFITKSNGRIWVESEQGKGSTFYFSLKEALN